MSKHRFLRPGSSYLMTIFHYDHLWPAFGHPTCGCDHLNWKFCQFFWIRLWICLIMGYLGQGTHIWWLFYIMSTYGYPVVILLWSWPPEMKILQHFQNFASKHGLLWSRHSYLRSIFPMTNYGHPVVMTTSSENFKTFLESGFKYVKI